MPYLLPAIKVVLRPAIRRWVRDRHREIQHLLLPIKRVHHFDRLRRVTPISRSFGWDRGLPIDRYYIEKFLSHHGADIFGRVLEIQSDVYIRKFGGDRVLQSDILDVSEDNSRATIVADLTSAEHVPSDLFDCIICTQTLLLIYDVRSAIRTLYRILKPGGVLLMTVPGVSHKISRSDMEELGDYWRFTSVCARKLVAEVFPSEYITVETHGNVLTAISFLHGLAVEELEKHELDFDDPDYEVSIGVRAVKQALSRICTKV